MNEPMFNLKQSGEFFYLDVGSETHGHFSFRLWVNRCFVMFDENEKPYIKFPVIGGKIFTTEKGSFVLRRNNSTVYNVFVPCGYRGGSGIKINQEHEQFSYAVYSSPQGSCGVSKGYLVNISDENPLVYSWNRTGRLYGNPDFGITTIHPDGTKENLDYIKDIQDLEELIDV